MADDNKIKFEVAVEGDAERVFKGIGKAILGMGDDAEKGIGSAVDSLKSFKSVAIGAAGAVAAFEAVKQALDLTFEAESIRATNQQFEVLARNAGISGEALKESLAAAADGLVDDTDLIHIANRAIIEMGSSAKDLGPVLEIARKATSAFGGDLAQNFEAINHAIASGSTKALKNLGIIIDSEKAYQKFAASIGVTKDALSQQGRQQALLNAVVEQGGRAFDGVNVNLREGQNTFQQLKVVLGQIGETATLAFERLAGPSVRQALTVLRDIAQGVSTSLKANFGEGLEKSQAQAEVLTGKINDLKARIIDLEQVQRGNRGFDPTPGDTAAKLQALPKQLKEYETQLAAVNAEIAKQKGVQDATNASRTVAATGTQQLIDLDKQRAEALKIIQEANRKEDPGLKAEQEIAIIQAADARKLVDHQAYLDARAQLEKQAQDARDAAGLKEINDLLDRNTQLRQIQNGFNEQEIQANDDKIQAIIRQHEFSAAAISRIKSKIAMEEDRRTKEGLQAFSGAMGQFAGVFEKHTAAYKVTASAQALISAYLGAQQASAAVSGIPIVGPVLAPIAFAGYLANGLATVAKINGVPLATGITEVPAGYPNDTFAARLTTGERVLNVKQNQDFTADLEQRQRDRQIMGAILNRLDNMATHVTVLLDGREIALAMRAQSESGRVVFAA